MRLIFCLFYIFFYIAMRWLFNIVRHLKWPKKLEYLANIIFCCILNASEWRRSCKLMMGLRMWKKKKTDSDAFKERTPMDKWRSFSIIFAHLNIHFILNMLIQTSLLFHLFFQKECKEDYPRFIYVHYFLLHKM